MISEELQTFARLADPAGWPNAAAALLRDLGFSLINSDQPRALGGAHLLVALRDQPALQHFDPEVVTYWAPLEPHAVQVTLDRKALDRRPAAPWPRPVLWGHVHVIDRLEVENRFLTFGGQLRLAVVSPQLSILDLVSPAPIVRWGGHSQDTDPLATEVGAFFGRLIVPVDYQAGVERRLEAEDPEAVYAAFLAWADARLDRIAAATGSRSPLQTWIDHEEQHLRAARPEMVARGRDLLASLGLA
jgi:hypothetical protein